MSDLKSKLPDMNELSSIAGKLFNDIKKSVVEIIDEYKIKHPAEPKETSEETPKETVVKDEKATKE